jgi:transposase-like protein
MAVERLKSCDNIVALSVELGVHRRLLYKWRDQLEPIEDGEGPPANSRERELRQQVSQLKRLVADKTLEAFLFFFKGALQKIEARRQSKGSSGETASTKRLEN